MVADCRSITRFPEEPKAKTKGNEIPSFYKGHDANMFSGWLKLKLIWSALFMYTATSKKAIGKSEIDSPCTLMFVKEKSTGNQVIEKAIGSQVNETAIDFMSFDTNSSEGVN